MSAWADKLRGPVGDGVYERPDEEHGRVEQYVIGHPHPLWQEMCDVIEAASRVNSHLRYGRRVPYATRRDLTQALDVLKREIA